MANSEDSDIDDDFSELYKEYTGPPRSNTTNVPETTKTSKRPNADSSEGEEQETLDPNAVPTDFTSRDAKVWEAKSKATERNWKKRKEEEMICKLCGDSSHYTQGCPSTLGANRSSQDLFQRVPARDPQVKALFTDRVIKKIEKEIGCRIKVEQKFIIVSGKDGQTLSKGVDAVHKVKTEGAKTGDFSSNLGESKSRSPKTKPADSQMFNRSPRNRSNYDHRSARQDKLIKENTREELHKYSKGSPQGKAYGNDGVQSRTRPSKSPAHRSPYAGGSVDLKDTYNSGPGPGPNLEAHSTFLLRLEELELEYRRDAMGMAKTRDKEEDEECYRHRDAIKGIRESCMKKLYQTREMHAKQWEEFLQLKTRKPNLGGYNINNNNYYEYGSAGAGNPYINHMQMESRIGYPETDVYPSLRSNNNNHVDFQRQRPDNYGQSYHRY